ncbi:phosphoglycerate dehydrogenase [Limnoglobus roseus]|uniref:Hydroxyacid dehydrogenase n=1 Tax=Limnoglobus roseus TaxID=2598579 RepID=A0A5C1AML7_9BACT|nr:phosphoglycerate dehydrogenase [Limnoglobus roseus]QEL18972.1 hydroxyacid dehydrogenase [Limnoglobus roseus]
MNRVLIGPTPLREVPHCFVPVLEQAGLVPVYGPVTPKYSEAQVAELLPGCVASLAGSEPYTPAIIEAAAKQGLKVIARAGVGYDEVNVPAATKHGVAVTIAAGSNQLAVAEHTFLLILALARKLIPQHHETKTGMWPRKANEPIRGRTLGVVGVGRIGREVVRLGRAFGMNVVASEILPDHAFLAKHETKLVSTDEVFATADYITLHTPLTPLTDHIVNARTLGLMKPTAFLVNTSRGPVVDESALLTTLTAKKIAGAALDVFEHEPAKTNPLFGLDNVVLTAHTAGVDTRSIQDMGHYAALAIVKLLAKEWPDEWVMNPEVREHFRK